MKRRKIEPLRGWILITRDEGDYCRKTGPWYVCWHDVFDTKREALEFAGLNNWVRPYDAVRGKLAPLTIGDR